MRQPLEHDALIARLHERERSSPYVHNIILVTESDRCARCRRGAGELRARPHTDARRVVRPAKCKADLGKADCRLGGGEAPAVDGERCDRVAADHASSSPKSMPSRRAASSSALETWSISDAGQSTEPVGIRP